MMNKEGEWIIRVIDKYIEDVKCSVCGIEAITDEWSGYFLTPYCPICGAKMKNPDECYKVYAND